jgi:hypothetical protein
MKGVMAVAFGVVAWVEQFQQNEGVSDCAPRAVHWPSVPQLHLQRPLDSTSNPKAIYIMPIDWIVTHEGVCVMSCFKPFSQEGSPEPKLFDRVMR